MYEYGYSDSSSLGAGSIIFFLVIAAFFIACYWRIFTKAGQPGWASLIPFYNLYVMLQIVGRPGWWLILMLIPCVNIVVMILIYLDMARVFGKSTGFAIGLILLSVVFIPILAFGDAEYVG